MATRSLDSKKRNTPPTDTHWTASGSSPPPDLADRFWAKVGHPDPVTGCREWLGRRDYHGYGRIGRQSKAYRLVWELANGPIPEGMCVGHRRDNPPCCEPDHLFVGTQADNVHDMVDKERGWWDSTETSTGRSAKISALLAGHVLSPETRAKISAARTGQIPSAETRAKMNATRLQPIRHGTYGGYRQHRTHGEPTCRPCELAEAARYAARKARAA